MQFENEYKMFRGHRLTSNINISVIKGGNLLKNILPLEMFNFYINQFKIMCFTSRYKSNIKKQKHVSEF